MLKRVRVYLSKIDVHQTAANQKQLGALLQERNYYREGENKVRKPLIDYSLKPSCL